MSGNETMNDVPDVLELEFCENCGAELNPEKIVWLELDARTNTFTSLEIPEEHSQGWFPLGKACAKKKLAVNGGD